ncbi:tyrosine-type recombinase/integrase [Deinococcus pimensis]|uniref:tyrosine-type recombinase/integrase n=1 Tax=Deinococcus pimensis TaxID=309888 RepID=UPI0004B71860|nr:tyrosine-type recombinase/integrase [Deinococcus pimensis]
MFNPQSDHPSTLDDLLEAFIQEQQYRGNSPATLGWYRKILELLRRSGVHTAQDFTRHNIMRFILAARERGLSISTLRNYDRALRGVCNWLHRNGYLSQNPMSGLPRPKGQERQVQPFTVADIERILTSARSSELPLRNTALVLILLDTGIRSGEACNLTLRDVDWVEGLLKVRGKTGERLVPFGAKTRRALQMYLQRERQVPNPSVQHVFVAEGRPLESTNLNPIVTKLVRRAGLERAKVGPHTFRHTFATSFLRAGGDVFTLQRILGHSKLEITQGYVSLLMGDIQAAHRRFSPVDHLGK